MSQLSVNGFKSVEDLSQFKEDFMKKYDENNDKEYFLKVDVEHPKKSHNCFKTSTKSQISTKRSARNNSV